MNLSKYLLPITAVLIVSMMIVPQFVQARSTVEQSITLDYASINEGMYDEVVNVANESAASNPSTWDPTYQGVWVGGPTQESLFQFNDVVTDGSRLVIGWTCRFTSQQIMSGASEMVVRLPIAVDEAVKSFDFHLFAVTSPDVQYTIAYDTPDTTIATPVFENRSEVYDMLYATNYRPDSMVLDGNDIYVTGDRAYITVRAPIIPDQDYLIVVKAHYQDQSRFKMYVSPNDVCTDGSIGCQVARYVVLGIDRYTFEEVSLDVDPGFSFDFRQGIGNGITSFDAYVNAGSTINMKSWAPLTGTGYHTLMIPFTSESGELNCSIKVDAIAPGELRRTLWTAPAKTYQSGYIIASSPGTMSYEGKWLIDVTLTVGSSQRLKFIMQNIPNEDDGFGTFSPDARIYTAHGNAVEKTFIHEGGANSRRYAFQTFNAYGVTEQPVFTVPPATPIEDVPQDAFNRRLSIWDELAIWLINTSPIGVIANIAVTGTVGTEVTEWAWRSMRYLVDDVGNTIPRMVQNAIDSFINAMQDFGKFLWSIGEEIFNILTWLVDVIIEYGSVLLGLLIIGVALALFFAPVYAQIKLWGIFLSFSEGKVDKAVAQAQDLASQGSAAVGKIKGLI